MKIFVALALALAASLPLSAIEKHLDVTLNDGNSMSFVVTSGLTWTVDGSTLTITADEESPAALALDNVKSLAYIDHETNAISNPATMSGIEIALRGNEIAVGNAGRDASCRLTDLSGREILSHHFDDAATIIVPACGHYIFTVNNTHSLKVAVK